MNDPWVRCFELARRIEPAARRAGVLVFVHQATVVVRDVRQHSRWVARPDGAGWRLTLKLDQRLRGIDSFVTSIDAVSTIVRKDLVSLAKWRTSRPAPLPSMRIFAEAGPRAPGCQCHLEEGDSPCRIHGDED